MRRKHEKLVRAEWPAWGPRHAVFNLIERGDRWFYAWHTQTCTTWAQIEKRSGIRGERLAELDRGAHPTATEIEALAKVWRCAPEQIAQSLAASKR